MRGVSECRWVPFEELANRWFQNWTHGTKSLERLLVELSIPTKLSSSTSERYYRGLDIVLAFGISGTCPTCLRKFTQETDDHIYCSEKCRRTAARVLESDGAVLAIGVPLIVTSVPGALLASVRRYAVTNGLTMQQAVRAVLLAGATAA